MGAVISLAARRAKREGWDLTQVEFWVFPTDDGRAELRFSDPDETYSVRGNREYLEGMVAKLNAVLGQMK